MAPRDRADGRPRRSVEPPDAAGLACRRCGCRHWHVLYTRPSIGGRILRRRECRYCGRRVTTYEHEAEA